MQKSKLTRARDYVVRHCKIVFPVLLIVVAAVTVSLALGARREKAKADEIAAESQAETETDESAVTTVQEDVPLSQNENGEIYTLLATYYNAMALGDTETILSVCSEYSDNELLRLSERAKYMEYYPALEIYTKPGPEEGSTVAYVYYKLVFVNHEQEIPGFQAWYICTDEQGGLYINTGELSDEVNDYITAVSTQDDVVELYNRVNVEYNEVVTENPELLTYMEELSTQVNTAVGTALAKENASSEEQSEEAEGQEEQTGEGQTTEESSAETPAEEGPKYATATTTVNVRSSDSEQADKLGKVSGGQRVQVQEVRVNGWTKILYEGKDGYIKSSYLQMEESAADQTVIGTVTATTNINVRSAASETSERLGVLAGGESLDLLAEENGWCKVNYSGQVGYVKSEYVTK